MNNERVQQYVQQMQEGPWAEEESEVTVSESFRDGQSRWIGEDPEMEAALRELMAAWEELWFVKAGWTVTHDAGDGAYRVTFEVCSNDGGMPRTYSKTEAEFGEYAMAIADALSDDIGRAAQRVAGLCRDEP